MARSTEHGMDQGGQGVTVLFMWWRWRREEGLGL